jgi:probable phosphoglycerate mutase
MNEIWVVRHGETEWSRAGRHTSRTDLPLTDAGRAAAAALAPMLAGHAFALVLRSPRLRAEQTASASGFRDAVVDDDLCEWDYGELEGSTTPEIRARGGAFSGWTIWRGPVPGGESLDAVGGRARRVVERVAAAPGDVLLFGHGHFLRVFVAVALGLDAVAGQRFVFDAGRVGVLGSEHEVRALRLWNIGADAAEMRPRAH